MRVVDERNSPKTMMTRKGFVVSMLFQFPNLEECYDVYQVLVMMNRVKRKESLQTDLVTKITMFGS